MLVERHGLDNPAYDKMYEKQGTLVKESERMDLVHQMDKIIHDNWVYTQLVNEQGIAAHSPKWDGFDPQLLGLQLLVLHGPAPGSSGRPGRARNSTNRMQRSDYIIKRTLFAILTVFVAVTLNFVLFRALPGDAVIGPQVPRLHDAVQDSAVGHDLGLDKSKWQQYVIYLKNLAHGDHGRDRSSPTSRCAASCGIRSRRRWR